MFKIIPARSSLPRHSTVAGFLYSDSKECHPREGGDNESEEYDFRNVSSPTMGVNSPSDAEGVAHEV